ncbi:Hpt domain-containing protein [Curvibacter sp. APW13]|uniref:hybrid sensor histidine kinase/response regulator n=1 Tax=Curvibacter sp. APW13 TaxID=3077236 RepID=UPI0028DEEA90|nr:Hpt domain-containing protein [Curvibacter sp. APW13]MDT8989701.1 Hpt domain-containing protein [Curvibacter sp. APW13]
MSSNTAAPVDTDLAATDLGPLAWVLDELRKSLDGATKATRRFVRDAEMALGSDIASLDASQLRIARQQLHQAVGALEMVGLRVPAQMLRTMESMVQRFVQRPELCSDEAATVLERASFALNEYLEGLVKGKHASAVALFPQYRAVAELAAVERVHPADLWAYDWRWCEVNDLPVAPAMAYATTTREKIDWAILNIVKSANVAAARRMVDVSLGLANGQDRLQPRTFWAIAAGFFEALAGGAIQPNVYTKRAASRVLQQYATLSRGDSAVSERLAQDLLFFCATAHADPSMPALEAVRSAFALGGAKPVDYEKEQFGRYDPALLQMLRKRIASASESWSALSGGDTHKLKLAGEQFAAVTDLMAKLHPESKELAQALARTVDASIRKGTVPDPAVAMEVATTVLYLEAVYEDLDPTDSELALRSARLAQRLDQVAAGNPSEPMESWMEDLYRRVSDRQTMGSVVAELRGALGEVEKSLDAFFRDPQDKTPLREVPNHLAAMRGVFSVLGLDQPSTAALRMRAKVEQLLVDEVDASASAPVFNQLGNNLGAMGFLIDMLSYQRELAKKLFVFDEESSELKPLMGREQAPASASAVPGPGAPAAAEAVDALPAVAAPEPAAAAPATLSATADDDDDAELLDIFLEEAREVVSSGLAAIANLADAHADMGEQTVLRRAFHTLKGSSRMVGLTEFGEAAWSFEQIMNARLAEQKAATHELLALTRSAMEAFGRWVDDIASGQADGWKAADFRISADAMRVDNRYVPLPFGDAPAQVSEPDTAPADEVREQEAAAPSEPEVSEAIGPDESLALPMAAEPVEPAAAASAELPEAEFDWDNAEVVESVEFAATQIGDSLHTPDVPAAGPVEELGALLDFEAQPEQPLEPRRDFESTQTIGLDQMAELDLSAAGPEAVAVSSQDEFNIGNFDLGDLEPQPAEQASPQPSAVDLDGVAAPEVDHADADFGLSFPAQATQPAELEPQEPAAQAPEDAFGLLDIGAVDAPALDMDAPTQLATLDDFASPQARESFEVAMASTQLASLDGPEVDDRASQSPAEESLEIESGEVDESVKVIGDLRLSIPLYNVYLNEADEWSRRLQTELSEWALQTSEAVPDTAIALAHSLQGSSATVGFTGLSALGRALEHALEHVQLHRAGSTEIAAVFVDAAEDIRRLLHQFAAGFIKESKPGLVESLQAIRDTEFAAVEGVESSALGSDDLPDMDMDLGDLVVESPAVLPEAADQPAPSPLQVLPVGELALPAIAAAAPLHVADEDDEDLDAVDNLDQDLFPIFEEEAQELLPQLATALRQWTSNPQDHAARNEVLRALHTLKGSARLAGAMRLGEMSHHMETSIEQLGAEGLQSAQIEPLQHRLDRIQAVFERLGKEDAQDEAEPQAFALPVERGLTQDTPVQMAATGSVGAESEAPAPTQALRGQPITISGALRGVQAAAMVPQQRQSANQTVRVRSRLLDRLVNEAGEVLITRSRMDGRLAQIRSSLEDLGSNLERLRQQLRDVELQSESQMQSRLAQQAKDTAQAFDPLEFDRFTRVQELTRMMAESVHDVATVQRNLQREIDGTEDDLIAQGRQARELQRDLLRTRMVEFDSVSERLYGVVRQAGKDTGKQVKLDIVGGSIEMDRGVLERMVPAFEHMLRNAVSHGIEDAATRAQAGKPAIGTITVQVDQHSNDVSVSFADDGAGLRMDRIRARAIANGLITAEQELSDADAANLIFMPGFSTAEQVTELSGRGIGMDVVRAEVSSLGGRIETTSEAGQGSHFKLILPLTTAVTQVVMVRMGELTIGLPSNLIETVQRAAEAVVQHAYGTGEYLYGGEQLPFYWAGALLQVSSRSHEPPAKTQQVVILRSAGQRLALHVDDVLGNREVVVKNLGPQLSRLPGLTGMSVLASGAVVLIYNPVALATVYGERAIALAQQVQDAAPAAVPVPVIRAADAAAELPLVLVVDDSITVRRVTQRLLKREGYRVATANDGLHALEVLMEERPKVVLSDIEMPRMDGFDLARNIRNDARLKDLPIIMITSRIAQKHRDHAKELGVNHYLGKPYSEDELLALVQRYAKSEEPVH